MSRRRPRWLLDAERVDVAIYAAVAATPTPSLDRGMSALTRAADRSGVWIASATVMALTRGPLGRRAALTGLASTAVTSAVVNLAVKPLARQVRMPTSRSLPSGHAASAFAFATGAGHVLGPEGAPLRGLAALVAYSRIHTGVHFPGDVVAGSLIGTVCAQAVTQALDRRRG